MSMGSFEQAVRISLETNDAGVIDQVIARIRELEQMIQALTGAMSRGEVETDAGIKQFAALSREMGQARQVASQFLQQQAALGAGFETVTAHIQASLDATRAFGQELKSSAEAQAETATLLNALIASGEREMNADARRETKETADAKKRAASDWAAYSKHINDLVTRAEIDAANEIKQADLDQFVHHLEMANAQQQLDAAQVAQRKKAYQELMEALGHLDVIEQQHLRNAIAAEADSQAEEHLNQVINVGAAYAGRRILDWAGFVDVLDASVQKANQAKTAWDRFNSVATNPAFPRFLMFSAQALEDFQFSFMAVVNNIPLVAREFGLLVGMAPEVATAFSAIASVSGIAVNQIIKHWSEIRDFFSALGEDGDGGIFSGITGALDRFGDNFSLSFRVKADESVESLKRQLKDATKITEDLGSKTRLTAMEMDQYDKARDKVEKLNEQLKQARELQQLLSGKSEEEEAVARGFKKAVSEIGPTAEQDVEDAVRAFADASGQTYSRALDRAGKPGDITRNLMVEAARGNRRARDEIRDMLVQANAGDERGLARQIRIQSPEAKQDFEDFKAQFEAAEKEAKENRELTEQGHEQELEAHKEFVEKPAAAAAEAAAKARGKEVAGVAGNFRPKIQEEVDLRAARMIADGQADGAVRAAILNYIGEVFAGANVRPDLRGEAGGVLAAEALERANARIGAAGAIGAGARAENAGAVVAEIEGKRAAAAARANAAADRNAAEAGGLIPGAAGRLMGQIERNQLRSQKQDDLEKLFVGFEQMGYSQQQANALAERSYALWTRGFSVMASVALAQEQLWAQFQRAEAQLMQLQRGVQRAGRARTALNRGGGLQGGG